MVGGEKYFQAGEAYGDPPNPSQSTSSFLSDPVKVATDILKDYVGVRSQASLPEIVGLIKDLTNPGQPLDDKKGTTELLIAILTALPSTSEARHHLTNKFIDTLWSNLQHPPLSYVGGDIKCEVVGSEAAAKPEPNPTSVIEFKAPDSDIILRQEMPKAPGGIHQYRMPDGSFNNVLEPDLGKAGTAYAKSVRNVKRLQGVKPDPGLLFDLLMAREEGTFKENPAGISSMLFYHAAIIIHDIFRTSRTDMNVSDVSSYLDLAPLYGSSLKDQLEIRTMKEGKLKPDTFHEKRLLGQPPGVNVMLVLYNRMHNYVADVLLKINEGGRFTLACSDNASPEDRAKAVAKQDHDLFNTARLIVGGLYINISLHDYLRGITNTHSTKSDWTLDPRVDITKQYDGEGVPRGVGNKISAEFNLLYRFHSCISKKDETWINSFFLKLFPGRNPDDLKDVSWSDLGQALLTFEEGIPKDPSQRTFDGLQRQADGRFKDEDLSRILQEAMDEPAGVFGARTVPKALKIVEILGINQARKWGIASLNEFREFFGLKRWEKFTDINSDPEIAGILEKLYADPDMVEFYPGLMIEDTKPLRNPGTGICPPYTLGRAVLSDAITLVRSDRFNTIDYTVSNLTSWGYNEVQSDSKVLGGSMLYKLIQRGLPGWFPYNSVAVMQPMYTKKANAAIAKKLGTYDQYTLDDPKPPARPIVISSTASIKTILNTPDAFVVPWLKPLAETFPGKKDYSWFMLAGDGRANHEHRATMMKAMHKIPDFQKAIREFVAHVGAELIQKEMFTLKEGLNQLDILRDIAIPLNARFLADLFYIDVKSDENPGGKLGVTEFYEHLLNVRTWGANNTDPALAWTRRLHAQEGIKVLTDTTRALVDEVVTARGFGLGISAALANTLSRKTYLKKDSLRSVGYKLVDELLAQGNSAERVTDSLWLTAFGGIGVPVTTFCEILQFFLRKENASIWAEVQTLAQQNDDAGLYAHVKEAYRLSSSQRTLRVAIKPDEFDGHKITPGSLIVLNIGDAGRNKEDIEDADVFNAKRTASQVSFGYGQHECFGQQVALAFIVGLVKLAADLKQLRPAPGQMGEVKAIEVGGQKLYLNDSWSYLTFEASTWKVHFDGHGKGGFTGEREPTKQVDLQQYYFSLQKRKNELLGNLAI
ncbi:linoleate diol synthase [Xylaria sp. CBS 124048]|nr:linoleate diol synthase [Xylaria sp. CBS 124048]